MVQHSTVRLARTGLIERRVVTWRSSRCRKRVRSEYRLPFLGNETTTSEWSIFPAWLLPAMRAEPAPQFIRSIRGKYADIREDAFPVTDQELFELPRSVREHFQALKDAQFEKDPDVVAARARLAECRKQHAANTSKITAFRARMDQLQAQQRDAQRELAATVDSRSKVFADAFLAEKDPLAADAVVVERIRSLEQRIAAIDKGLPHIQRAFNRLMEAARSSAMQEDGGLDHLRGVTDRLKLAEAWRRYNE
jgi:hypothetical protein